MPKVKVPRKSTIVDMTAMCDVSFLLLTFFILTAKFKPQSIVAVDIPTARSTKVVENAITITVNKEGKAFISLKEKSTRYAMLEKLFDEDINIPEHYKKYAELWNSIIRQMYDKALKRDLCKAIHNN